MSLAAMASRIKERALELGFHAVGITSAARLAETEEVTLERVRQGLMEGLPWFTEERARLSCRPQELLADAKSVVALAVSYLSDDTPVDPPTGPIGKIARYARGDDYHAVLKVRLKELSDFIHKESGATVSSRPFIDSSPLSERAAARRAGVGWFGKNNNLIVPGIGSWAFLSALILDLELEEDRPLLKSCGSCDLCIRACPTGALVDQYTLDNTKCISFQTIENRGEIPEDLRPEMGQWVFGCDICQDVCPANRKALPQAWDDFKARPGLGDSTPLAPLLQMDGIEYQTRFKGSAVKRAKRRGLQRNTAVALGNTGDTEAVPGLQLALESNDAPLVRSHVAWAMGRIGGKTARRFLERAKAYENDAGVLESIEKALECLSRG
ncbi:MAG: tRNA epoxyqueuosine(34) reductase QueG [Dehalococcoidia bacterium]|nr:tRNA epoxyqueuosine(34) reductase QueG [Dehalococcoidia bacterium]